MTKWADKVIVAVHYSDSGKSNRIIDTLKVCDDKGDKLGSEVTYSREKVISDINLSLIHISEPTRP